MKIRFALFFILVFISSQIFAQVIFSNGFEALNNKVVLGPLADAEIRAFQLSDLTISIEGPINSLNGDMSTTGEFSLELAGIPDEEWVLVSARGGNDIDADDNGVLDVSPTQNNGTIYALAKAKDWRTGGKYITALTDICWRYTKNLLGNIQPTELIIRQNELAKQFIQTDINNDNTIDYLDVLSFLPNVQSQQEKLNFDYQILNYVNFEGNSIIKAIHNNESELFNELLDEYFQHTLTRFPAQDHRYDTVQVKLNLFGDGAVNSSGNLGLSLDSTTAKYTDSVITTKNDQQSIVLTAVPTVDTQVVNWHDCDIVSNDLSQCTITLNRHHNVIVTFGYKQTQIVQNKSTQGDIQVIDLSRATNTVSYDKVDVIIPTGLSDLITEINLLQVDGFIVGDTNGGFLRKVTAINQITLTHYIFDTIEATLEDVISNGTLVYNKEMTNQDLVGYVPPSTNKNAQISSASFSGPKGVKLIPSNDPNDTQFTLQIGEQTKSKIGEKVDLTGGVSFRDGKIVASGTLNFGIKFDIGSSYSSSNMKYFKLITDISMTESFNIAFSEQLSFTEKAKLGTAKFVKSVVFLGFVPVYISGSVDFWIGADGKVEGQISTGIEATQKIKAGFTYNKIEGFSPVGNIDPSWEFDRPSVTVKAYTKSYVEAVPNIKFYGVTGPAIPITTYYKIGTSASVDTQDWDSGWDNSVCIDGINAGFYFGLEGKFKWDLSGDSKVGKFLHLDDLESFATLSLFNIEWPLGEELIDYSGNCSEPSHLDVNAIPIISSIPYQTPLGSDTATQVELTNSGGELLVWSAQYNHGSEIQITPSSGTLNPGDIQPVNIVVDSSMLNVGTYVNNVLFQNMFDPNATAMQSGTTEVPVIINVLPLPSVIAPNITNVSSSNPGKVNLNWEYDTSLANFPVTGYLIYTSVNPSDPNSWQLKTLTMNFEPKSVTLSGYQGGQTVSFKVLAFGDGLVSVDSNIVTVIINGNVTLPATGRLNDTGITWGGDNPSGNNATCTSNIAFPQDCDQGRDATHNDDSGGHSGFSFTKLDENGNPLDALATEWSCVRDNVTGLVWEVKTDDGGIHDKDNTYRWGGITRQGDFGTEFYDDWGILVNGSNSESLCGFNNWKVPSRKELVSIINYAQTNPAIDVKYFPNTKNTWYWSATLDSYYNFNAWSIRFDIGSSTASLRDSSRYVRLVTN